MSLLPLFPGYLFLCGGEADRLAAVRTDRIVRVIEVADQQQLIGELAAIRRLLGSGAAIDPHRALRKGRRCRIRAGPLVGVEGVVERRRNRTRFVVAVTALGQGVAVEIDADLLEALD